MFYRPTSIILQTARRKFNKYVMYPWLVRCLFSCRSFTSLALSERRLLRWQKIEEINPAQRICVRRYHFVCKVLFGTNCLPRIYILREHRSNCLISLEQKKLRHLYTSLMKWPLISSGMANFHRKKGFGAASEWARGHEKAWLRTENRTQLTHMLKRKHPIYVVENVNEQNKHSPRSNKQAHWQRLPKQRCPLRCHVAVLNGLQTHS